MKPEVAPMVPVVFGTARLTVIGQPSNAVSLVSVVGVI
jgi:hypothetical protein